VLPSPFWGMGAQRTLLGLTKRGHTPRLGPEVENRSKAKDGVPESLRCRTFEIDMRKILQMVSAGVARSILLYLE